MIRMIRRHALAAAGVAAAAVIPALSLGISPASASPAGPRTLVVAHPGSNCGRHVFTSINAALAAASPRSTVIVCRGSYNEDAVVTKPVTLVGRGAVINPSSPMLRTNSPVYAQAGNNGITVLSGGVTVKGFTITGATGDGVLAVGDHSAFLGITSNKNSGIGIDLAGSSYSAVKGNVTNGNTGGGIQLANDAGGLPQFAGATSSHDTVANNVAKNNVAGCGIIVVDHLDRTMVPGARGIFGNLISGNVLINNGTTAGAFGPGAGVVLASFVPGGAVYDNTVVANRIVGSGLAGVTLHSHLPGQNLNGNLIVANNIGTNNVLGDFADTATTGVYVGSVDPLRITAVVGNRIHDNHNGIFAAGPITVVGHRANIFSNVAVHLATTPTFAG